MTLVIKPFNNFPEDQYYKQEFKKTQLVLHYSAGWDNARGMFQGWMADKQKVATCDGLVDDGTIYRCFDPKYYAAHIGYWYTDKNGKQLSGNEKAHALWPETANRNTNYSIEIRTIGIEVCNWGYLDYKNGKYLSWVGAEVHPSKVITYEKPWRGKIHFERFTEQEICSLDLWIRQMCSDFNIPMNWGGNFDLDKNAVLGVPGIYMHTNFHAEKQDMHPQPELIEMLNQFKTV